MKLSLMTLSMFIRIYYRYHMQQDMDDCIDLYDEMMRTTKDAGFDTVEVTSRETSLLGVNTVLSILHRNGLSTGGYMFMDNLSLPSEQVIDAVAAAETLGADTLMLIPSWHTSLAGMSRDEIHQIYAHRWSNALQIAASKGIQVVVEDTPDQRLHLCKAEDVTSFLDLLPGAELVYDSGNMILAGEDPITYAQRLKDHIAYVHLKDMRIVAANSRGADIALDGRCMSSAKHGNGIIPLKDVITELTNQGYCKRWVIELSMDGSDSYMEAAVHAKNAVQLVSTSPSLL